ncbi:MAG: DUF6316 family protein [Halioglobus sp.]|jgi:hypothetical protein
MKRKNDSETQFHFRTDRIFEESGKWFFHTREGTIEGPFTDELEAETWVELHISLMCSGLLPVDDELSLEPIKLAQAG